MGIIDTIFKRPRKGVEETATYFKTLTGYAPVFQTYEGGVYEMELTRSAIATIAKYASKLTPSVVGSAHKSLAKTFQFRPNPFMDTPAYIERLVTILLVNNTAFIVPIKDDSEQITGYYPIIPQNAEIVEYAGKMYMRYRFSNGQRAAIPFDEVGVLTRFQYKDDFFGENNAALKPTMQLINANNQGILNGIKNSAYIRFLAKISNIIAPEDISKERKRFTEDNLSSDNQSGVIIYDNKFSELKEIQSKPFIVSADQMEYINQNVSNYFGVNQNIMQSKYSEDDWNAFYEGTIEPLAIKLSVAHSNMTYTKREIATGNEIIFSANRLQYASNTTKLNVSTQLFDRGLLTRNQIMDIWNLPHVEDGDTYYIRRDYALVDEINKEAIDNAGSE